MEHAYKAGYPATNGTTRAATDALTQLLKNDGWEPCIDREGVDREGVHARLAPQILTFVNAAGAQPE